jgi:AcrR family transcriptional regulator
MARTAAEGTRERILTVATDLFYQQGVRAVGMNQIIDAAGCGKNLLYTHFPSKTDLVAAYLTKAANHREQEAQEALATAADPRDQIVALTHYIAGCVADPGFRGCALRNYVAEFPADDSPAARIPKTCLQRSRDRIGTLTRRARVARPTQVAERVWLIHEGLYATATRPWLRAKPAVAVQLVREILTAAQRQ